MQILKRLFPLANISLMVSIAAIGQSKIDKQTLSVTTTDNISIVYDMSGDGSMALVFVHGWSCDRSYWKKQIIPFSKQYKVISIDLGGHGDSGLGRENWTIKSFGNDVATVIKKQKLEEVILVGHSMGGDIIVDAALQLRDRVAGLIMLDTYKKLGNGQSKEQIQAFVDDLSDNFTVKVQQLVRSLFLPHSDSSLVNRVAKDMSSAPPAVALSAIKSSFTHGRHITHDLELLNLPVITINPDNEPTDFESMRRYHVETIIMPSAGHFLMMEDPERFNELLEKAIKKIVD